MSAPRVHLPAVGACLQPQLQSAVPNAERWTVNPDNVAIARACYLAFAKKNRVAIEPLIADDFHFTSPLNNRIDRGTYFERCWPNSEHIEAFDFIHLVPDGDRVFVTYEGRWKNGSRFRNTEIMIIGEGRIVEVEVYFGWNIPHRAAPGGSINPSDK
jgi:hypothetical protein